METISITCPSCNTEYKVLINPSKSFTCSRCDMKVKFDLNGETEIVSQNRQSNTIDEPKTEKAGNTSLQDCSQQQIVDPNITKLDYSFYAFCGIIVAIIAIPIIYGALKSNTEKEVYKVKTVNAQPVSKNDPPTKTRNIEIEDFIGREYLHPKVIDRNRINNFINSNDKLVFQNTKHDHIRRAVYYEYINDDIKAITNYDFTESSGHSQVVFSHSLNDNQFSQTLNLLDSKTSYSFFSLNHNGLHEQIDAGTVIGLYRYGDFINIQYIKGVNGDIFYEF